MKIIDDKLLAQNRDWLITWQKTQWSRKTKGIRLHLGCGNNILKGYINVDPYAPESDSKEDMRKLSFESNSVFEIVCEHALEHIPIRDVIPALKHWYDILSPGGTVEIGVPDLELCIIKFLTADETEKWNAYIWAMYGAQAREDSLSPTGKWNVRNDFPFEPGQVHKSGFTLDMFIDMLKTIGFKILKSFNYDGLGTPSAFIYAEKPR